MTPTSSEAPGRLRQIGVNFGQHLPALLFAVALIPFATVRAQDRLVVGLLAGALGLVTLLRRDVGLSGLARVAGALAVAAWLGSALAFLPVGAGARALLQPGLAPALEQALQVANRDVRPLALDPWRGLVEWAWAGEMLLLALGVAAGVQTVARARTLAIGLVGAGVGVVITAVIHRGTDATSIWWVTGVPAFARDPIFAPFVSPNHGGACAAALVPLAAVLAWEATGVRRALALGAALILAGGVAISGGRAAAIELCAGLWMLGMLAGSERLRGTLGSVAVGAGASLLLLGPQRIALWVTQQITPELYESIKAGYGDVLTGRGDLLRDAVALIQAAPWVGVGPGGYDNGYRMVKSTPDFTLSAHAHQELLQLAAEHGVPVALLWVGAWGLLGALGVRAAWARRDSALLAGFLALLGNLALDSQVDFPFRIGALSVLGATAVGAVLGLSGGLRDGAGAWRRVVGSVAGLAGGVAVLAGLLWTDPRPTWVWGPSDAAETRGDDALAVAQDAIVQDLGAEARDDALEAADKAWRVAVWRDPSSREALQKLGRLQQVLGNPDRARATLKAATAVYPTMPWPWMDLARLEADARLWKESRAAWRRMLWSNLPEPGDLYVAEAMRGPGGVLQIAAEALPERADRWVSAARQVDETGQQQQAQRLYERAAELAPAAGAELAGAFVRWGRLGEAEALLPTLPATCRTATIQGDLLLAQSRWPEAVTAYEAALKVCGSKDRRTRLGLARARLARGDMAGLRALQSLVDEDTTDLASVRILIHELEEAGRMEDAARYRELLPKKK